MKKIIFSFFVILLTMMMCGCSKNETTNKYMELSKNIKNEIEINTESITSEATYANYEVDGVIVQFILVRGTDGVVRIAFNTCQACNPSPTAYFIQKGEYLECQNCKNKFHIDKIGVEKGGCNPAPVEEKTIKGEKIVIDASYVESYKDKFENWKGPVK